MVRYVLIVIALWLLVSGMSCSVKSEVQGLSELKASCDALEMELAGLKAIKWTPTIDKQVALCQEHGFWKVVPEKKRKRKELIDDDPMDW